MQPTLDLVVEDLEAEDLMVDIEDREIDLAHSSRPIKESEIKQIKEKYSQDPNEIIFGGIAAVMSPDDDVESHVADTLRAGAGLCHPHVVERVVGETGKARADDRNGEVGSPLHGVAD